MTVEEVRKIVQSQARDGRGLVNHGITLERVLVMPVRVFVMVRLVKKGRVKEEQEDVWLVGQENAMDGYRIIMRESDGQFGLASARSPVDRTLTLVGWYGTLRSAFLGM